MLDYNMVKPQIQNKLLGVYATPGMKCVNLSLSAALYLLPVSHLFRYQRTLWCHLLSGLLSEIILHQFFPVLSDHADHLFFDTLALHTLNLGKIKSVRLAQYFLNPSTHEDLKQRV